MNNQVESLVLHRNIVGVLATALCVLGGPDIKLVLYIIQLLEPALMAGRSPAFPASTGLATPDSVL